MTEAELEQWALQSIWGAARVEWLRLLPARFVRIPSSRDLILKWAEGLVAAARSGRWIDPIFIHSRDLSLNSGAQQSRTSGP